MEARGAAIIPTMLSALSALTNHRGGPNLPAIAAALTSLTACIHSLGTLLARMDDHCRPAVFYHRIRPFLAGSKNMAAAGLPNGVFYDEGEKGGEWRQLRGGSNGQSSLIQFLDLVLGVEHTAQGNGTPDGKNNSPPSPAKEMSFHEEVRGYMPEPHRRFLQYVAETWPGGMRKGVEGLLLGGDEGLGAEQVAAVQEAFQTATRALAEFRNQHLQMVARYIIIPSRQPNGDRGVNLATASSRLKAGSGMVTSGGELTGTGGTALLPFLKQSRDETFQAGELRCQA
jgi:indoleamine 2,3-dioxygenase